MKETKNTENESLKEGKKKLFNQWKGWQNRTCNRSEWESGLYEHLSTPDIDERQ